ncbi:hypothetical protein MS3_00003582 [Schistosoma haematobium]|uniref:Uncharacterized protein n=1 Tax=Schistosoma haematobium TaxID=6185 RepID=A0A922LQA6_SCHHA|nr:hypothetical protein MS3_00003582 [Schistosoma haematobium]KAH9591212.1 hypothetical protein MS3_00003582 [Schistosoma haematobium]
MSGTGNSVGSSHLVSLYQTLEQKEFVGRDQDEYVPETFKRKLTGILNNIRQVRPELIPQQVAVGYFADISCYEGIIPLKEYMKLYDIPYETSSQSELTWPIERNSFIYK